METDIPSEVGVVVIGAGPGGYVGALRAADLGHEVVLVEDDEPGGTCLNHGCIPSKALLSMGELVHEPGHAEEMGVYADPYVDWDESIEWMNSVVDKLTGGVEHLCRTAGVELVSGRGEFVDTHEIAIDDGTETHTVTFEHAIVATGSQPIRLPGFPFDSERVLTSRDVFQLDEIPTSLVIVGGGYIGLELATLFAKLGTEVTVLEMESNVLPGWERDISDTIRSYTADLGVSFAFEEAAVDCDVFDDHVQVTTEDATGGQTTWNSDRVVVAVGREPVSDTAGLETVGVSLTDRGFVAVDEQCRTNVEHIYAVGDVAGEPMLAHRASAEGMVAAETIAGGDASTEDMVVPAVVFTDPEVAVVGRTESQATEDGYDVVTGRMSFEASGRALATNDSAGFARAVVDRDSERLLGAQIVGPHASELVGEMGVAVTAGLSATEIAETVHAHPTLTEALMEACADAVGDAIHTG